MESVKKVISRQQYAAQYVPLGAWIVVVKHKIPEKYGSIIIPKTAAESSVKFSMTGTVVCKSPFSEFENGWEAYLMKRIHVGDTVGFTVTVPIVSPSPPNIDFDGDDIYAPDLVTMHVADVLGIWCDDETKAPSIKQRFQEEPHGTNV